MAGSAPPPVTPTSFAGSLLGEIGAPKTPANLNSIVGWEAREGGNWHNTAKANPLNTTENAPGATSMNGVGVKSYLNWNQGVNATARTLENGDYGDILGALRAGKGLSGNLKGLSTWSGGGYSSITPTTYNVAPSKYGLSSPSVAKTPKFVQGGNQVVTAAAAPQETRQQYIQGLAKNIVEKGGAGNFSSLLMNALQKHPYTPTLKVGTTQNIPGQHLGTIAQLGDDPHNLALAGAMAISHDPRLGEFNRVVTSANNVNKMHYNYEWGGGHNTGFQPTSGVGHGSGSGVGYDCSGVLSHIFHMAGLLNEPLVSGQFAELNKYIPQAKPGVGSGPHTITVYANADHTFAKIGNTYFGTSSENKGGGAGWIGATTENNNADFTAWHIDF